MKNYIVYRHTCPNGKCYIGITGRSISERLNCGHGYDTQFFGRAIAKYGIENIKSEVLHENLTLEQAQALEIEEIAKHKSNNPAFGYNCTIGGESVVGYKMPDEVREKLRRNAKALWGKPEIRAKLLEHLDELNHSRIGKPMNPDVVRKIAISNGRKIDQYTLDGKYITTHLTAMDAARSVGRENNSDIVACCKGRRKYAQGFIWRYADESGQLQIVGSAEWHGARYVNQLTRTGEYIRTFSSMTEAANAVGGNVRNIHSCANGKRKIAYGYKWEYADTVS